MKSMTGFAEESTKYNNLELRCIIRSLNSRFLEINIKTLSSLKNSEGWIRDMIQEKILRGKIDIELYLHTHQENTLVLSESFVKQVLRNEKTLRKKGLTLAPSSFTSLFEIEESFKKSNNISDRNLKALINKSLSSLINTRVKEGKVIKKDLQGCITKMQTRIKKIKKMEKSNFNQIVKKFKRYKKELNLEGKEINISEVFSNLNKSDINEEVVRFTAHLDHVKSLMGSKGVVGKKLDFYSQELLREVNTMSSKALISDIKNECVELKSQIERIKEHSQNVE